MAAISTVADTSALVSGIAPVAPGAAAAAAAKGADKGEDRFLKLLVAQMKNQDPLNPLDNAQVTSQMAQISTVTGIDKLNETLKALAGGFGDTQSLQAASLIGRDVLLPGNALALEAGAANGGFELSGAADQVSLEIRDAAGNILHRAELGAQAAGVHFFQWDGVTDTGAAAAAGSYRFSVTANGAGAAVETQALTAARVLAVSRDAAGTQLELSGLGRRGYADVRQIL